MSYIQTILCDFSDDLKRVDVIVDGFAIVDTSCRSSIGGVLESPVVLTRCAQSMTTSKKKTIRSSESTRSSCTTAAHMETSRIPRLRSCMKDVMR